MRKLRLARWGLLALTIGALAGCDGGSDGAPGANGTNGSNGTNGKDATAVVRVSTLSTEQWAHSQFSGQITAVDMSKGTPVVSFKVTDASGLPVVGLGNKSKSATATVAGYTNLAFAIAKLQPAGSSAKIGSDSAADGFSKWNSYVVTSVPTTAAAVNAQKPGTDNTGTLVDNGDGSYQYTFYRDITKVKSVVAGLTLTGNNSAADLGDLTYDANLVHRVAVILSGNAPGTGTNTADAVQVVAGVPMLKGLTFSYDFVPATGAVASDAQKRDIVSVNKCFECHTKFQWHGGARQDTKLCVTCHTDQRKYGNAEAATTATGYSGSTTKVAGRAIGTFPNYIHKIHMGTLLTKDGYNFGNVLFDKIGFPQDRRNCTKCHDGNDKNPDGSTNANKTPQGNNWQNVPNRVACGSCHDGINFATGAGTTLNGVYSGHVGGVKTDDSQCALCHTPDAINTVHTSVTPPDANNALLVTGGNANTNAASMASNLGHLPAGAIKPTYDLKSVTLNSSRQPVLTFRILADGQRKDFNAYTGASGKQELWDNFVGSPSVYLVFAVPQDGVSKPADYNATASGYVKNIWNGTATGATRGSISGPDASGYYTVTLTGVVIPTNASLMRGAMSLTYNVTSAMPLTQTNVAGYPYDSAKKTGGLLVPAPAVWLDISSSDARRVVVDTAKCQACHQSLGIFSDKQFHAGQRNQATLCSVCHNPNRANGGWAIDSGSHVHAIHASGPNGPFGAASKRSMPFTWTATAAGGYATEMHFPGVLANCEGCHVSNFFSITEAQVSSGGKTFLPIVAATGTLNSTTSPYTLSGHAEVDKSGTVNYGTGFTASASATTGVYTVTEGAGTNLVHSKIAGSCFACHDSEVNKAHFRTNGGSIYEARSIADTKREACFTCHGAGKIADVKVMHEAKYK